MVFSFMGLAVGAMAVDGPRYHDRGTIGECQGYHERPVRAMMASRVVRKLFEDALE
jgi:hypothetical protein